MRVGARGAGLWLALLVVATAAAVVAQGCATSGDAETQQPVVDDGGGGDETGIDASDEGSTDAGCLKLVCGTSCVDPQTDPNNCGGCGNACAGGKQCTSGKCTCTSNQIDCGGTCVDPTNDNNNCGSCGNACPVNTLCSAGACGIHCAPGWIECNAPGDGGAPDAASDAASSDAASDAPADAPSDAASDAASDGGSGKPYCAQTGSDNNNCGGCGIVCKKDHTCTNGSCALTCTAPAIKCSTGDICITPPQCCTNADCTGIQGQTCPAPGGACTCPAGQKVCGTTCIPNANCCTDSDCSAITGEKCQSGTCACPSGTKLCGSACIPSGNCCTDSDCNSVISGEKCISGSCACPAGEKVCGTQCIPNGNCCTDSDCGSVTGETCQNGTCSCPGGTKLCGSIPACISTSPFTCCTAADCPPESQVTGSACASPGGQCAILSCTAGYFDLDHSYGDGCECQDTSFNNNQCTGGGRALGTVALGGSIPVTATLPQSGESAYFTVTFTGNTSLAYHPKVVLTTNPLVNGVPEFAFDIVASACASPTGCSGNITSWDVSYNGPVPGADPNSVPPGGGSNFQPIPPVGTNGTIYIRVYRVAGSVSCDSFTLTVSN